MNVSNILANLESTRWKEEELAEEINRQLIIKLFELRHTLGKCVFTMKEGDSFGELALMEDKPRAATIVASEGFLGTLSRED